MKSLATCQATLIVGLMLMSPLAIYAEPDSIDDAGWRYTFNNPGQGWESIGFDDRRWSVGNGGFGTESTPGSRVGTRWETNQIWLRRDVTLKSIPDQPALLVHHDEDARVFLNGKEVAELQGYSARYKVVRLGDIGEATLVEGENLLAVHCRQTDGGQFIDVHLIDANHIPQLPPPIPVTTPFKSELITRWGSEVTAENVWQEYPRPQMVRENWKNLNGEWDYTVTSLDQDYPEQWSGKILVPFCLESKLSGVQRLLEPSEALWYRRDVDLKANPGGRVLLNFEAVDYRCRVWLNEVEVGSHVGGNNPFALDVTEAVRDGKNELVVRVEDATGGPQLRGKQRVDPKGIWYTRVSGIWQTVWAENVPARYLKEIKISSAAAAGEISVRPILEGAKIRGERVRLSVFDGDSLVAQANGDEAELSVAVSQPRLWSPARPHLYNLKIELLDATDQVVDSVTSYAGIRTVGRVRDDAGHWRFTLNGKILFHWGPLDQGWWPDGLLTPPSDAAMRYDVDFLKEAGFNMIRKHIKVEPRRYYTYCDRIGMLVWQDHVSGGEKPAWTRLEPDPADAVWSDEDHDQFMREFEEMVSTLENHPSIVVWVPFNEAWGQHRTIDVGKWTVNRDPTRLVNIASGGNFWPVGDVVDAHKYPHPDFPWAPERFGEYVKVMGEFGGHGWPVQGHLWDSNRRNWGYGELPESIDEYMDRYRESLRLLVELKKKGVAGGVYTQTTDVEGEINGLMTYDRKVLKIPAKKLNALHAVLFEKEHHD